MQSHTASVPPPPASNVTCESSDSKKGKRNRPGRNARKIKAALDGEDGIMPQPGKFKRIFNSMIRIEENARPLEVCMSSLDRSIDQLNKSVSTSVPVVTAMLADEISDDLVPQFVVSETVLNMVQRIDHSRKASGAFSHLDFISDVPLPAFHHQRFPLENFGEFQSVGPAKQYVFSDYMSTAHSLLRLGVHALRETPSTNVIADGVLSMWYPVKPNDRRTICYIAFAMRSYLARGNPTSPPPPLDVLEELLFSGVSSFPPWFIQLVLKFQDPLGLNPRLKIADFQPFLTPIDSELAFRTFILDAAQLLRFMGLHVPHVEYPLRWTTPVSVLYSELERFVFDSLPFMSAHFRIDLSTKAGPGTHLQLSVKKRRLMGSSVFNSVSVYSEDTALRLLEFEIKAHTIESEYTSEYEISTSKYVQRLRLAHKSDTLA